MIRYLSSLIGMSTLYTECDALNAESIEEVLNIRALQNILLQFAPDLRQANKSMTNFYKIKHANAIDKIEQYSRKISPVGMHEPSRNRSCLSIPDFNNFYFAVLESMKLRLGHRQTQFQYRLMADGASITRTTDPDRIYTDMLNTPIEQLLNEGFQQKFITLSDGTPRIFITRSHHMSRLCTSRIFILDVMLNSLELCEILSSNQWSRFNKIISKISEHLNGDFPPWNASVQYAELTIIYGNQENKLHLFIAIEVNAT